MHVFSLFLFFALGVTVSMVAERLLNTAEELRAVILVGLGVGFGVGGRFQPMVDVEPAPAPAGWLGITLSGAFVGGGAYFWHVVLGFFSGLSRKFHDEAATLEKTEQIHGLATGGFGARSRRPAERTG